MRHLISDAALNRFKHLEAGSGLRANAAPQVDRPRTHLEDPGSAANLDKVPYFLRMTAKHMCLKLCLSTKCHWTGYSLQMALTGVSRD
jgi:hypothetical protein